MASLEDILKYKVGPAPKLVKCEKCGFDFYFYHDCKKALEKEKSPAEKLKDKFNNPQTNRGKRK